MKKAISILAASAMLMSAVPQVYASEVIQSNTEATQNQYLLQQDIDLSDKYNALIYGTTDTNVFNNPNVVTGPNAGFEVSLFKSKKNCWENTWQEGVYDNYYLLDGTRYKMRVKEGNNNCAYRASNNDRAVDVFEVENAIYDELRILANTDNTYYSKGGAKIGIVLVYEDGTRELKILDNLSGSTDKGSDLEQNHISGTQITANGREINGELYIHEFKIDTQTTKVLDKIEILNSYAYLNESGTDVVGYKENGATTEQTYRATIYSATLVQSKITARSNLKEYFKILKEAENTVAVCAYYLDILYKAENTINALDVWNVDAYTDYTGYEEYTKLLETRNNNSISDIVLYVSSDGNDQALGREDSPLKTFCGTVEKIRQIRMAEPSINVKVYFDGGEYFMDETVVIDEDILAENGAKIEFLAKKNQTPVFTGAVKLDSEGFAKVSDNEILTRIPKNAADKVLVYDLTQSGISKEQIYSQTAGFYGSVGVKYNTLFLDCEEQALSKWPNSGYAKISSVENLTDKKQVTVQSDNVQKWSTAKNAVLEGFIHNEYSSTKYNITSVDTESNSLVLDTKNSLSSNTSKRYYISNLLEELDIPGEYYIEDMKLYYYPINDLTGKKLELSVIGKNFIKIANHGNITISGLNFKNTSGDVIAISDGEKLTIDNCTFKNIGRYAISGIACKGVTVSDSDFKNLGNTGVYLSGGNYETLEKSDNVIQNCTFNKFSQYKRCYSPAVSIDGVGAIVKNNVIHNSPHEAIGFNGNDHLITQNEIYDVCLDTSDCGAIYSGRNLYMRGVEISHNYIHNVKSEDFPGDTGQKGIYFDDRLSGGYIHHNIFKDCGEGIFVHGGQDMTIANNIFVDSESGIGISNCGGFSDSLYSEAKAFADAHPIYYERYPEMKNLYARADDAYPRGNIVRSNLLVNSSVLRLQNVEIGTDLTTQNISENNKTIKECEFKAPTKNDYSLPKDSALLKEMPDLGDINTSVMGLSDRTADNTISSFKLNAVTIDDTTVTAVWENDENVDKWICELAIDESFDGIVEAKIVYQSRYEFEAEKGKTYYLRIKAVKDSINATEQIINSDNPKFILISDKTSQKIIYAEEKWEYGDNSGRLYDYPKAAENNVNGGFGWSQRWGSSLNGAGLNANTTYVKFHNGLPDSEFKVAGLTDRSILEKGFWSNGPAIYRGINAPAEIGEDGSIYLRFTTIGQKVIGNKKEFAGMSVNNDTIFFGAVGYSETADGANTENRVAIMTPDGNIHYGNTVIKTRNNIYSYIAKITKNSQGQDEIALKAYRFGVDEEMFPTDWDVTVKGDFDSITKITDVSYKSRSSNTYHGSVTLYKNAAELSEGDLKTYVKFCCSLLPENITAENITNDYISTARKIEAAVSVNYGINFDEVEGYDKYIALKSAEKEAEWKDLKNELLRIVNSWKLYPTAVYVKERFNEYSTVVDGIKKLRENGVSVDTLVTNQRYTAMNKAVQAIGVTDEIINIDSHFNSFPYGNKNITTSQNPNVVTGPNAGFEINAFKALDGWKYDWANVSDYFNTLNFDNTDFRLKVRENGGNCVWRTTGKNSAYEYIDVEDGNYTSIEVLANTDTKYYGTAHMTGYLGMVYVYSDGSEELEYKNVLSGLTAGENAIVSEKITAQNVVGDNLYLHKMSFKPNTSKTLMGIKVVQYKAYLSEDKKKIAGFSEDEDAPQDFRATIYAMTGKKVSADSVAVIDEIESLIAELPENVTASDCEKVDTVYNKINTAKESGYIEENILNIQKYYNVLDALAFNNGIEISEIDFGNYTDATEAAGKTITISTTVTNKYFRNGLKGTAYLAFYNTNGDLLGVGQTEADIQFGKNKGFKFREFEIPEGVTEDCYFKLLVWSGDGLQKPLTAAKVF